MNKKLKILLISTLVLVAVVGGYLLYIFQFKEYEVADEEIEEIMEHAYDVELPNGTKLVVESEEGTEGKLEKKHPERNDDVREVSENTSSSSEEREREESSSGSTSESSSTASGGTDEANTSASTDSTITEATSPAAKITVGDIKRKFERSINDLEEQVDSKINSLTTRAKDEYNTKKQNGESVSYAYFYNKYMGAAENLEAQTDMVFEGIVGSLEKDLEANGFNKAYSQSFRDQYAAQKKARRDRIMNDAMK